MCPLEKFWLFSTAALILCNLAERTVFRCLLVCVRRLVLDDNTEVALGCNQALNSTGQYIGQRTWRPKEGRKGLISYPYPWTVPYSRLCCSAAHHGSKLVPTPVGSSLPVVSRKPLSPQTLELRLSIVFCGIKILHMFILVLLTGGELISLEEAR